jgi:hypothetical protein
MAQQGQYRDASVVTARSVVPGPIAEYTQPYSLTTGSQINEAAEGGPYNAAPLASGSSLNKARAGTPWPGIINGAVKFFNSWRPNALREIANHNVPGNYGSITSEAGWYIKGTEFPASTSQALYPGPVPDAWRPMWNNLVPIIFGLRVLNPNIAGQDGNFQASPQTVASQFTEPTILTPTGTASLAMRGEVLQ